MVGEIEQATAERVIRANRHYYADRAEAYDSEEHCISDPVPRERLASVLSRALVLCPNREDPAVLDACGGSGNASEILMRLGYETTLVDVSPEMLEVWRAKAAALGCSDPDVVASDIYSFLSADERLWDLIVFSSALHHLDNYCDVAAKAVSRLAPGGVLVTIFDPTASGGRVDRLIRRLDWVLPAAVHDPSSLLRTAMAKAGRGDGRHANSAAESAGALAERHAISGVDEGRLIQAVESAGASILVHERYSYTKLAATEIAFRIMGAPSSFHLVARKTSNKDRN